jgi:hypothetical protein
MAINPRLRTMLDRTADVQAPTYTKDAGGVTTPSFADLYSDEPCAIWPASNAVVESYHRRDIIVSHQIAFGRDLGLTAKHRISEGGVYYLVKGVNNFANSSVMTGGVYVYDVEQRIN